MIRTILCLILCTFIGIAYAKNSKFDEREEIRRKRLGEIGATIVAGAIDAGTSIATTTIDAAVDAPGKMVSMGVVVENWTIWMLRDPIVHITYGQISKPPRFVLPSQEEVIVAHETGGDYGSGGVLSYNVREINRTVYIMWMVTKNPGKYSNWLAVGIDSTNKDYSFNAMYYGTPTTFMRGKYWDDLKQISYTASGITVEGVLGSAMKSKATIIVKPTSKVNLTDKVKKLITERL